MDGGTALVEVRCSLQPPEEVQHLLNRLVGLGTCKE